MKNSVLYEINYINIITSHLLSLYTIIGILLIVAVIFFTMDNIFFKREKFTLSMIVRLFAMMFIGIVFFLSEFGMFLDSLDLYKDYKNGQYSTVQGIVENFNPIESDGKGSDTFTINGVNFEIFSDKIGYNKTQISGSVIKGNGQKLKIYYKLLIAEEYKNDPEYFDFQSEEEVFATRCKEYVILKIEEIK